jgi:hypothetical protein
MLPTDDIDLMVETAKFLLIFSWYRISLASLNPDT